MRDYVRNAAILQQISLLNTIRRHCCLAPFSPRVSRFSIETRAKKPLFAQSGFSPFSLSRSLFSLFSLIIRYAIICEKDKGDKPFCAILIEKPHAFSIVLGCLFRAFLLQPATQSAWRRNKAPVEFYRKLRAGKLTFSESVMVRAIKTYVREKTS